MVKPDKVDFCSDVRKWKAGIKVGVRLLRLIEGLSSRLSSAEFIIGLDLMTPLDEECLRIK